MHDQEMCLSSSRGGEEGFTDKSVHTSWFEVNQKRREASLFLTTALEQDIDTEPRQTELLMGLESTHCCSYTGCPTNKCGKLKAHLTNFMELSPS
jgi:hypothetical protein